MKKSLALVLAALAASLPLRAAEEAKPATCPVSGEKLGEMGKPYVFTHEGKEVSLCCSGCKETFDKDPAKYLKIQEDAAKAAK
jgi:YHS domain-containing protein